jgi:hypothetical protein
MAPVHRLRSNPSHPPKRKWRLFGNDEICLSLVLLRLRRLNNHSSNILNSNNNNNTLHLRSHSTNTQMYSIHNNIVSNHHLNNTLIYSPNNIHIRTCRAKTNSSLNPTGIIPISTATEAYTTRIQCRYRQVMADHHTTSAPRSLHSTIIPT